MNILCEKDIEEKVRIIQGQTDYTKEIARVRLLDENMDEIIVIKKFLGIYNKKEEQKKTVQQEIYKQMRLNLDKSIKDFNDRQYKKLEKDLQE
jgi:hypothetical protein